MTAADCPDVARRVRFRARAAVDLVACPVCWSRPGWPCADLAGEQLTGPHADRADALPDHDDGTKNASFSSHQGGRR